jgi:hypothetical protein
VFSVTLSVALAAFAPILPVSSVASGVAVAVCFTPEEDCAAFAVRAIDNAEREILDRSAIALAGRNQAIARIDGTAHPRPAQSAPSARCGVMTGLPQRGRGRQTVADAVRYQAKVAAFSAGIRQIQLDT